MITRLEVDGFKSLRDFAIELGRFTVLVGPNSAGKSNVLDALALLSRLAARPIDEAFKQGRGRSLDQFTRCGGEAGRTIRFAVEGVVPAPKGDNAAVAGEIRYRYELAIERETRPTGVEHLAVYAERLCVSAEDHATQAPHVRELFVSDGAQTSGRRLVIEGASEPVASVSPRWTALASLQEGYVHPPEPNPGGYVRGVVVPGPSRATIAAVAEELSSFRLLQIDAGRLREPSELIGAGVLAPDASNLPTILADLPPPVLGGIRADLCALVPGIASFHIVSEGEAFRIDFELSGGERLPARLISDGTLRVLAILTALRIEPAPSMLCVEEPENGVYPGRLRALLSFLREAALSPEEDLAAGEPPTGSPARASGPPQLLLTSHSPVVLAALRASPEHLRFIDLVRRNGQLVTRARTVTLDTVPDRGRRTISLREIDALLDASSSEAAE